MGDRLEQSKGKPDANTTHLGRMSGIQRGELSKKWSQPTGDSSSQFTKPLDQRDAQRAKEIKAEFEKSKLSWEELDSQNKSITSIDLKKGIAGLLKQEERKSLEKLIACYNDARQAWQGLDQCVNGTYEDFANLNRSYGYRKHKFDTSIAAFNKSIEEVNRLGIGGYIERAQSKDDPYYNRLKESFEFFMENIQPSGKIGSSGIIGNIDVESEYLDFIDAFNVSSRGNGKNVPYHIDRIENKEKEMIGYLCKEDVEAQDSIAFLGEQKRGVEEYRSEYKKFLASKSRD